jgi:hypothetical protein
MANIYKPLLISTGNISPEQTRFKQNFEIQRLQAAEQLARLTGDERLQYMCYRYRFYTKWNELHFPLINEYADLREKLSIKLAEQKDNPLLHRDKEYRSSLSQLEKSISIVQKALGISNAIESMIDQYEQALDTEDVPLIDVLEMDDRRIKDA